jgi:hypothetical protein
MGEHGAIGAYASGYISCVSVVEDIKEVRAHEGLAAPKVDLKDIHAIKLIYETAALVKIQLFMTLFHEVCRKTVTAIEITLPGDLPSHIDRRCKEFFISKVVFQ